MISITKDEKKIIAEQFPDVHIVRTMKNDSNRHHYFMEEYGEPLKLLHTLRREGLKDNKNFC